MNKKAKKEMIDYCKKNGISYQEKIINIPTEVRRFSFINLGDERTYESIMSMNKQNKKIFMFCVIAHSYLFKDGRKNIKHSRVNGGTICLIVPNKTNDNNTPSFYIRDIKNGFSYFTDEYKNLNPDVIYEKFGGTTIKLANNQEFSNRFFLMGHSETEVNEFLTPDKTKYFLNNHIEKYKYEAGNNSLMVFCNTFYGLDERLDMLKYSLKLYNSIYPE